MIENVARVLCPEVLHNDVSYCRKDTETSQDAQRIVCSLRLAEIHQ